MSKFRTIVVALVIALVLSIIVTFILQYTEGTQIESLTHNISITISNETTFGTPYEAFLKKGFFDSVGQVYVYVYSPYADDYNIFNVWESLDNSSWVTVPFLESTTNNFSQMASLGFINFANPQLTIYMKYYIPPQTLFLPSNVTIEEASTYTFYVAIKRQATPTDTTQWIIVFGTIFSVVGFILNSLLLGKDSDHTTPNVTKKEKKPLLRTRDKRRISAIRKHIKAAAVILVLAFFFAVVYLVLNQPKTVQVTEKDFAIDLDKVHLYYSEGNWTLEGNFTVIYNGSPTIHIPWLTYAVVNATYDDGSTAVFASVNPLNTTLNTSLSKGDSLVMDFFSASAKKPTLEWLYITIRINETNTLGYLLQVQVT